MGINDGSGPWRQERMGRDPYLLPTTRTHCRYAFVCMAILPRDALGNSMLHRKLYVASSLLRIGFNRHVSWKARHAVCSSSRRPRCQLYLTSNPLPHLYACLIDPRSRSPLVCFVLLPWPLSGLYYHFLMRTGLLYNNVVGAFWNIYLSWVTHTTMSPSAMPWPQHE